MLNVEYLTSPPTDFSDTICSFRNLLSSNVTEVANCQIGIFHIIKIIETIVWFVFQSKNIRSGFYLDEKDQIEFFSECHGAEAEAEVHVGVKAGLEQE